MPIFGLPMAKKTDIVIAEDGELFRHLISKELLEFGIRTVGEASNGKELLKILSKVTPRVLLLDLEMPVMNGSDAMVQVQKKYPGIKIIIMSQYDDNALMESYIARGVAGYIPKNFLTSDISVLANAIKTVSTSGTCFYSYDPKSRFKFTKREAEIIPMIFQGKTNKEIAESLNLVEKSIEKHRKNLYEKTGAKNVASFIALSVKKGFEYLAKP